MYVVYAARKNGKKISDYPSVEPLQNVAKTNIKYFFLDKKPTEKSNNISHIKT